jgi:hypothetical protein
MNASSYSKKPFFARGALVTAAIAAFLAAILGATGCDDSGGPNVEESFRVVLVEPRAGATGIPCPDTVFVTFNSPIDTTAVYDDEAPRFFLATIQPGAALNAAEVALSNPETTPGGDPIPGTERTLVLPFTFLPNTNYTFNFLLARGKNGEELETTAQTSFRTAGSGQQGCP